MMSIYSDMPREQLRRLLESDVIGAAAKREIRQALTDGDAVGVRARRSGKATVPEAVVRREAIRWLYGAGALLVVDAEQGYRPDACRACGASLGKGARTRIIEGFSDPLAFWPDGGVWWIEFKSDVGIQTPAQLRFQRACEAAGEIYLVVRSNGDLEQEYRRAAHHPHGNIAQESAHG